jgi:polyferredoxin
VVILFISIITSAQVVERFPKPDFQSDYTRPEIHLTDSRSQILEYVDIFVLFLFLSLASYFGIKLRSRKNIFILVLLSAGYFGFYREGCVCSVGSIQNVTFALFNSNYIVPVSVIIFFILPLIFTLLYGRTFCSSVCPLGAIQDIVILRKSTISTKLSAVLSLLPYLYLGLALLFAVNGAGFIICQYDPFVGFFRFNATFNMIVFGGALMLLGTFVARPYCRFLCPYGVILSWMSFLSRKHVKITPDKCNNCRLCESSCPVDAIRFPEGIDRKLDKKKETKKIILLFALLPIFIISSGWIISNLNVYLSKQHFTVWLAEQIELENKGEILTPGTETKAFRASGKSNVELFMEADEIRNNFAYGGWVLGGLLSFVLFIKLVNLSVKKNRSEYEIDKTACISCGKCFIYCPYEKVRLGILSPEEVENY